MGDVDVERSLHLWAPLPSHGTDEYCSMIPYELIGISADVSSCQTATWQAGASLSDDNYRSKPLAFRIQSRPVQIYDSGDKAGADIA